MRQFFDTPSLEHSTMFKGIWHSEHTLIPGPYLGPLDRVEEFTKTSGSFTDYSTGIRYLWRFIGELGYIVEVRGAIDHSFPVVARQDIARTFYPAKGTSKDED